MLRKPERCILYSALILFLFAAASTQAEQPPSASTPSPIVIDGIGKGLVELSGPWQFHTGDNPAWAAPAFDDSRWERLTADNTWAAQGHAAYSGVAWYRIRLALNPAPGAGPDLALILHDVQDAYEIYWNGVLIGHNGQLPPHAVWYVNQPAQTFGLGDARTGLLALRVWKAVPSIDLAIDQGGLTSPPIVGGSRAISNLKDAWDYAWLRRQQLEFGLKSLFALVAMLSLIAWLRDRSQWYLFWITIYAIFPVIYLFVYEVRLPLPNWVLGLGDGVQMIENISVWFLLLWLLDLHKDRRTVRFFGIFSLVVMSVSILQGFLAGIIDAHWTFGIFIFTIFRNSLPFGLVVRAVRLHRRLEHSRWLVAIFACLQQMVRIIEFIGSVNRHNGQGAPVADKLFEALFTLNGNPVNAGTLTDTLLLLSILYAVYRYSAENRQRQTILEQEFKSARELQQVLIPETLPKIPGFDLTSAYLPAQEVGGDFFQIIPLTGESTLVVLGDVSGKGLRAAMTVSLIVGAIHALANEGTSPARLLGQLNRRLHGRLQGGFATCIALRLSSTGACVIASAGHPGPFCNGKEMTLPGSFPLGLAAAAVYEEISLPLSVGDRLNIFTDGLLEARNPAGELFGFPRLETLFATNPTATQASEAAVAFGQDDDITVLTLTRLSTGQESTVAHTTTLRTLARPV